MEVGLGRAPTIVFHRVKNHWHCRVQPSFAIPLVGNTPTHASMRLHVLSDLHLEFGPYQPPPVAADVVVFAGDFHPGGRGLEQLLEWFPGVPVLVVAGNHEYYGRKIPKLTDQLMASHQGPHLRFLERSRVELGDCTFLGTTLWTDFELGHDRQGALAEAAHHMNDYRKIRVSPSYRRLTPSDTRRLHQDSIAWLRAECAAAAGRKLVVITHHAPSGLSLPPERLNDPLAPAYASPLDDFVVACGAVLWVHGHIHHASDYRIGGTRVLANPRGYVPEIIPGFDPSFVVEI